MYARVEHGEQRGHQHHGHGEVVHEDDRPEHREGVEPEQVEAPADDRRAQHRGEHDNGQEAHPQRREPERSPEHPFLAPLRR